MRIIKEDNNKINENKLYRFRRGLKNGKVFIYDTSDENFRGFGKTTEITRYALEHNLPIVVGSPSLRRHIQGICNSEGIDVHKIYTVNESYEYGIIKYGSNILVDILGLSDYIGLSRKYNVVGGCVGIYPYI